MFEYALIIFLILYIISISFILFLNYSKNINQKLQAKQRYLNIQNNTKITPVSAYITYFLFLMLLAMTIAISITPEDLKFKKIDKLSDLSQIIETNVNLDENTLDVNIRDSFCSINEVESLNIEVEDMIYYVEENRIHKVELTNSQEAVVLVTNTDFQIVYFCFTHNTFLIVSEKSKTESKVSLYDQEFNLTIEFDFSYEIEKAYIRGNELIVIGQKDIRQDACFEITILDSQDRNYAIELDEIYYANNTLLQYNLVIFKVDLIDYSYRARTILVYDYIFELVEDRSFFYVINASSKNNIIKYFTIIIEFDWETFLKTEDLKVNGLAYNFNYLDSGDLEIQTVEVKNGNNIIIKMIVSAEIRLQKIELLELTENQIVVEKLNKAFLIDIETNEMTSVGEIHGGIFVPDKFYLENNICRKLVSSSIIEIFELDYHYLVRKKDLILNNEVSFSVAKANVLEIENTMGSNFRGGIVFGETDNSFKIISFKENNERVIDLEVVNGNISFTKNYILVVSEVFMVYNYLGELLKTIE